MNRWILGSTRNEQVCVQFMHNGKFWIFSLMWMFYNEIQRLRVQFVYNSPMPKMGGRTQQFPPVIFLV
jgi:hypothetical protein